MNTLLSALSLLPLLVAPTSETVAIRVGKAETIANGPLEHAVILIENGKITAIGEDLPVKEGAYLKIYFRADARSKKMVKDAWAKVDDYDDKVKKAKEKWEKDVAKAKKSSDKPKDEGKPEDKPKDEPKPDEKKEDGK